MTDCTQNRNEHKLVHEGTSQEQRFAPSLDPGFAPVDEHGIAHSTVFAQAYSAFLQYYDANNAAVGDWKSFFSDDVSVLLAAAAVQDVDFYRQTVREYFNYLDNRENQDNADELRDHLDYLFSCCATLAVRLDLLHKKLPDEIALKETLRNCIQSQLASVLKGLIAYNKGGAEINVLNGDEKAAPVRILGGPAIKFSALSKADLSRVWTDGPDWQTYYLAVSSDSSVYGSKPGTFNSINHITTHNLFTAVFNQFLKAYARIVDEAGQALQESLTKRDHHEPHYALFLAFLRLFEHARREMNTLTGRHLDFYYRDILRLKEKEAEPGKAHLLLELAKQVSEHEVKAGELFKAGKDDLGKDVFFANNRTLVANRAEVAALKTVFRCYPNEKELEELPESTEKNVVSKKDAGRIYASPISDSADGMGEELTSEDQSWHPFFNKIYKEGKLSQVDMPKAEIGFAIASHYLLMEGGTRTVTVTLAKEGASSRIINNNSKKKTAEMNFSRKSTRKKLLNTKEVLSPGDDFTGDVTCYFTGEKGWIEKKASVFNKKELEIGLTGADPAVVPYSAEIHGYDFQTDLPVLLVKLDQQNKRVYAYGTLKGLVLDQIDLKVDVTKLKTLAVSNDFGPVDTSKPFQPFGASPVAGSALVVGSKEAFQKALTEASLTVRWQNPPTHYGKTPVYVKTNYLYDGEWIDSRVAPFNIIPYTQQATVPFSGKVISDNQYLLRCATHPTIVGSSIELSQNKESKGSFYVLRESKPYIDTQDLSALEYYSSSSRYGFVRLELLSDFGQEAYLTALRDYLIDKSKLFPPKDLKKPDPPPIVPIVSEITLAYKTKKQPIKLNTTDTDGTEFGERPARFFHLTPFGQAEQHPFLNVTKKVFLLPQFHFLRDSTWEESESEFYIGITGLKPPQNLALLFQMADGTADPLIKKPDPHIHWSYLSGNEWLPFKKNQVEDHTGGLLNSGIITFSVPRDASDTNTWLPSGMHWLRAAVSSATDAVCRLRMVAAQALETTFANRDNDPAFPAKVLPSGTISKLARPYAAVKKVKQPFETFGGRGKEAPRAFYTRISERLRHKDRAVALWDYERLVLEAFPQIYKVKCLNHTAFEPGENGNDIYRESAPGHVTVITVPNQQHHTLRDPLRPYTSLGLLEKIKAFLHKRSSCFIGSERLHVRNPLFEEVQVTCSARFYNGFDETFYKNKLLEAITRFLSPWAFPGGGSPSFGGKIYKSVLINFIEEQSYVDYVTEFKLFHYVNGEQQGGNKNEVEASKAVSILVSAGSHTITPIQSAEAARPGEKCPCTV